MAKAITGADAILRARAGITLRTAVARILATFDRATPADIEAGATWYGADASAIVDAVADAGSFSRECAATVIAHLSPRTTWARNVMGAMAAANGYQAPGIIGANYSRAANAIGDYRRNGDPLATLNGPKTRAFAYNLLGDRDHVTIDVWAARVALDPDWRRGADSDAERTLGRAGVYGALETAYRIAARRRGVDATTMQATTWVVVRNGRAA